MTRAYSDAIRYPPLGDDFNLNDLPESERFLANARRYVQTQLQSTPRLAYICHKCWVLTRNCFCDQVKPINTFHRYYMYMHYKEVYRGTNTGVLVTLNANNSEILICGKDEDEEKLRKMIEEEPDTTVVMYPSQDSVVIQDFVTKGLRKAVPEEVPEPDNGPDVLDEGGFADILEAMLVSEAPQVTHLPPREYNMPDEVRQAMRSRPLNVILLDATWTQAKTLMTHLPESVVKVRLSSAPGAKSKSSMRKQTREGNVTTAEACAYIFNELGEDKETVDNLWANLDSKIFAMSKQTRRDLHAPGKTSLDIVGGDGREEEEEEEELEFDNI